MTTRELSDEEIEWLEEYPVGGSHSVEGGMNLAACSDCEWVAQGDSFDYLMELVTAHLEESFSYLDEDQLKIREQLFVEEFGWSPWQEGVITEDDEDPENGTGFDMLLIEYIDDDGNPGEEWFTKELEVGPDEEG